MSDSIKLKLNIHVTNTTDIHRLGWRVVTLVQTFYLEGSILPYHVLRSRLGTLASASFSNSET